MACFSDKKQLPGNSMPLFFELRSYFCGMSINLDPGMKRVGPLSWLSRSARQARSPDNQIRGKPANR